MGLTTAGLGLALSAHLSSVSHSLNYGECLRITKAWITSNNSDFNAHILDRNKAKTEIIRRITAFSGLRQDYLIF
jgi:hypothetical protein